MKNLNYRESLSRGHVWMILAVTALVLGAGCAEPLTSDPVDGGCAAGTPGVCSAKANKYEYCKDGRWKTDDCVNGTCVIGVGCRKCTPKSGYCVGQAAYECNSDGTDSKLVATCPDDQQCVLGRCMSMCELDQNVRSNVGCEFWAVDLPNEYYCMSMDQGATCVTYGCAACQQFAVVVANTSSHKVKVKVEINEAKPGETPKLKLVQAAYVERESLTTFKLPMREVDCTSWAKDKTGKLRRKNDSQTCLSSTAYRITSTYPVVAYQFNPIVNQFSNGASLLIPKRGLDKEYLTMGWTVTNPIKMPMGHIEGIPDYASLTIVGIKEKTDVEVTLTYPTQASKDGKVKAAKKGETIKATLGPFDVLNLNSQSGLTGQIGDLTGSRVKASKEVVVFSSVERASVPSDLKIYSPKPPEPSGKYDVCCTEHFEQQMFPLSSLGKNFAISRTPPRQKTSPYEPDLYRVMAAKKGTKVTTSLTNFPSFTLDEGKWANFWSTGDFVLQADQPVMVAQYAVAQGFLEDQSGPGGDPEFVIFPPVEQYRKDYIFLTPTTFTKDFVVIAAPTGADVTLDGVKVQVEVGGPCTVSSIGTINTRAYKSMRCPVKDGVHRIKAKEPVGIMVYGYYNVGSYGYPGGSEMKQINVK